MFIAAEVIIGSESGKLFGSGRIQNLGEVVNSGLVSVRENVSAGGSPAYADTLAISQNFRNTATGVVQLYVGRREFQDESRLRIGGTANLQGGRIVLDRAALQNPTYFLVVANRINGDFLNSTGIPSDYSYGLAERPGRITIIKVAAVGLLTPEEGSTAGGSLISIAGANFFGVGIDSIKFDGVPSRYVRVVSDTEVVALTPPHSAGSVDVIVTRQGVAEEPLEYTYSEPYLKLVPDSNVMRTSDETLVEVLLSSSVGKPDDYVNIYVDGNYTDAYSPGSPYAGVSPRQL